MVVGKAEGQILPFTHYTTENEINALPSAEVHKVYQDRQGYLWLAIYSSGLVRYNGVNMVEYGTDDGLRDLTVWDLIEDPTGRLWVSSNAGLMVSEEPLSDYKHGRRVKFISASGNVSLMNMAVSHNKMAVSEDGWLWVGTESMGVIRYRFAGDGILDVDTLEINLPELPGNKTVRALEARRDSSVWVSLLNGNIARFKTGEQPALYRSGSSINTNALYESPEGVLWGGEQDGRIWRLEESDRGTRFLEVSRRLTSNISSIGSDSYGHIWISSEGSGLGKMDPENDSNITVYNRSHGLLSEIVFNILEDRERNIWIAQSGGISKLRYNYQAFLNLKATSFGGEKPVLPSPSINAVLPPGISGTHGPCRIWAGSSEGGIACINERYESVFIQQEDGLTGNWVNGLEVDSAGRIWVGTARGLNSITFGSQRPVEGYIQTRPITLFGADAVISTYEAASILSVAKLNVPVESGHENNIPGLWFPAYHEVYAMINGQIYTFDQSWGLPATIYHAAAFDGSGYLWIGTRDRGIYRSREPLTWNMIQNGNRIENRDTFFQPWWSIQEGAPTNQIDNLLWHRDNMWIGTTSGLIALDGDSRTIIHVVDGQKGLPANNATSITFSPVSGSFWLGTNLGLAEIDPGTGSVLKTVSKTDGLVDNEVWFYGSVRTDQHGDIYFGTAKGISIYKPYADLKNNYPPVVYLTNITSEEVPGERNEFSFEYAALSFSSERNVRYRTRLQGFNDEWSAEKTEVKVNYTNLFAFLIPKTYTFEVQAANESGVWSVVPASYDFKVNPPWWFSWWASLGYLVIFAVGVFVVDRVQRSRLIKKEREAARIRETELKAETAIARSKAAEAQAEALRAENDLKATELEKARELEKAYHELKSTQKRLIQAEKMASLGRLSAGIAHEIKNPLNFINNFAVLSNELVEELQQALKENDTTEIEFITKNLSFNTQKIEEHGKRADSIVKSMMQHSRGGKLDFESTKVNELVKTYVNLAYQGKIVHGTETEVEMAMNLDPDLPDIFINAQQIGQVIQNIIENALDAVLDHAKKVNHRFKPKIDIATRRKNGQVEILVTDNGPGIPETVRERIFEPFFTTKPPGEGTGLGLSISYDIITQIYDGEITVKNLPKGGARFKLRFPSKQEYSDSNT